MNGSRCRGLMIKDRFLDLKGQFGEMWVTNWHYVNCSPAFADRCHPVEL